MARKIITSLIDDIDGSEASKTINFAVDGTAYEIDLSERNAAKLAKSLAPYIEKGRKVPATARAKARTRAAVAAGIRPNRKRTAAIRTWAIENGHEVGIRGRIPEHIMAAYEAANPNG